MPVNIVCDFHRTSGGIQPLGLPGLQAPMHDCRELAWYKMALTNGHTFSVGIRIPIPIPNPGKAKKKGSSTNGERNTFIRNIICRSSEDQPAGLDALKTLSRALWGKGLPPQLLVAAVRTAWSSGWKIMMTQLAPSDPTGSSYRRPPSAFRGRPSNPVGSSELGRYHLYAALACPWAHRTLIVRALKGLEHAVGVSIPVPGAHGPWEFRPVAEDRGGGGNAVLRPSADKVGGRRTLLEVYRVRKGGYDGRATVPVLWDTVSNDVLNNESADIIEILNSDFNGVARNPELDLSPNRLRGEIQRWNDVIYPNVNNGVYRCGFAQSQEAYEIAVECLFNTLDRIEVHLAGSRYLCGDCLTLADIRLFTTLFRFDPVYHILFKCTKKKLSEYPNLYGYMLDIYQMPGVASTCDIQAIMDGYYRILFPLNPGGIQPVVPIGFESDSLRKSHKREMISLSHANLKPGVDVY